MCVEAIPEYCIRFGHLNFCINFDPISRFVLFFVRLEAGGGGGGWEVGRGENSYKLLDIVRKFESR